MGRTTAASISTTEHESAQGRQDRGQPWDGLSAPYVRDTAARRLRALGHPDRLRAIEALAQGPAYVGEIAGRLGLSLSTTSRHLRSLHDVGLVQCSHRGNHVLYVLADHDIPRLAALAYRGAAVQAHRLIVTSSTDAEATEDGRVEGRLRGC